MTTLRGFMRRSISRVTSDGRALAVDRHRAQHEVGERRAPSRCWAGGEQGGAPGRAQLDAPPAQPVEAAVEERDLGARPSAARAAERPSTPAPRTTKCAGGTPGAPPSRMPLPPNSFRSRPAPTVTARLPAISDMLVRTGAWPCSSSMASRPTAVTSRASRARRSSRRSVGKRPERERRPGRAAAVSYSRGLGSGDARRPGPPRAKGSTRPKAIAGPRRLVVGVGVAGAEARARLHPDAMALLDQALHPRGSERDPVLAGPRLAGIPMSMGLLGAPECATRSSMRSARRSLRQCAQAGHSVRLRLRAAGARSLQAASRVDGLGPAAAWRIPERQASALPRGRGRRLDASSGGPAPRVRRRTPAR